LNLQASEPCAEPGCYVTHIYHITHISNLPAILASSGLDAKSVTREQGTSYIDIAHQNIQDRRSHVRVPIAPFGTLHDYMPFYFAPRSPMLFAIHKGAVVGYRGSQDEVIYLVSSVREVNVSGIPYTYTDGHATMAYTNFYNQVSDLAKLNWNILRARYWHDRAPGDDRKRRRQAEFLVYRHFAWSLVERIAVHDEVTLARVSDMLANADHQPIISVRSDWYY
jgi:ssDNA thymidine ADP-ribosyltransferase, DarT